MEIIQEYDNWRRVRDADGAEGWINQSLLSGRRTAIAAPWQKGKDAQINLLAEPDTAARTIAIIEPGVIGTIKELQRRLVRDDLRRPYRLDQPVAGLGRLSGRTRQGLSIDSSRRTRRHNASHFELGRSNGFSAAQAPRFGRSLTTISTLAISMPSGGSGRLITLTGPGAMSKTLFSPSMKK